MLAHSSSVQVDGWRLGLQPCCNEHETITVICAYLFVFGKWQSFSRKSSLWVCFCGSLSHASRQTEAHLSRTKQQELNLLRSGYGIVSLNLIPFDHRDKNLFTLLCLDLKYHAIHFVPGVSNVFDRMPASPCSIYGLPSTK